MLASLAICLGFIEVPCMYIYNGVSNSPSEAFPPDTYVHEVSRMCRIACPYSAAVCCSTRNAPAGSSYASAGLAYTQLLLGERCCEGLKVA